MLTSPRAQAGATLIEVLVAILVITFGMLAMAAVQSNAVKFNKTAEYRSTAMLLATELADRMRANNVVAKSNAYAWSTTQYTPLASNTVGTDPGCGTATGGTITPCTASNMALKDLVEWRTRLVSSLPGASGHIGAPSADGSGLDLWVAWADPDETDRNGTAIGQTSPECPPAAVWQVGNTVYHCLYMRVAL